MTGRREGGREGRKEEGRGERRRRGRTRRRSKITNQKAQRMLFLDKPRGPPLILKPSLWAHPNDSIKNILSKISIGVRVTVISTGSNLSVTVRRKPRLPPEKGVSYKR